VTVRRPETCFQLADTYLVTGPIMDPSSHPVEVGGTAPGPVAP
jgi:hypothetical protein